MFEFFKRLVSSTKQRGDDVVFLVDLPEISAPAAPAKVLASVAARSENSLSITKRHRKPKPLTLAVSQASHRERLLAMKLSHLNLCPERRCEQLAAVGIQTAGDLVFGHPQKIATTFRHPERAERAIRRYRAAIKLALTIDSMMPRDALLLVAIHRRSVASLARDSAAQLHRDLERFSLSSRGSKLVGNRGVPSLRRVKAWVAACREMVQATSPMPQAA